MKLGGFVPSLMLIYQLNCSVDPETIVSTIINVNDMLNRYFFHIGWNFLEENVFLLYF
jgi:hypothetical protein